MLYECRLKRTGKRDQIFLATKFGAGHGDPTRFVNGEPEYAPRALQKSLDRLGVDYVDLWYLHRFVCHFDWYCARLNLFFFVRIDPTVPIEVSTEVTEICQIHS